MYFSFRIISIWYVDEMEDGTDSIAEFVADVAEEVIEVAVEEVATEDLTCLSWRQILARVFGRLLTRWNWRTAKFRDHLII